MNGEKNYFKILNVSEDAEIEVIRSAYKALAKKYHPDTTSLSPEEAHRKMALLNEAYEVLSDEEKKKRYLEKLALKNGETEEKTYSAPEKEYDRKTVNDITEASITDKVVGCLFWLIILVCIACCFIYFGIPQIEMFIYDMQKSIDEIISTFK